MIELKDKPDAPAPGGALAHIAEPLRPLAVPVASLNLDSANARTHPEKNLAAIRASLSRFGQRQPLVVQREGMIVRAGNGRLMAAKALGWSHVAAIVVDESAIDATAYAIADNRTSDLAEWDDGTLARLLESLPSDLKEAAGYDDKDMKELLASLGGDVVEDEAPEPLPEPVSRRGDLWVMGGHRILCGDSTDGGDVALVMNGETCDLCFTSPPYNAGKYTLTGNVVKRDKSSRYEGQSDDREESEYVAFLVGFTRAALSHCRVVAVNIQQLANNKFAVLAWVSEFREHFVDRAVWYKGHGNPAMAANVMDSRFEDIWLLSPSKRPSRAIATASFRGTVENVIECPGASADNENPESHAATMPMAVCTWCIMAWSGGNATIYEPFSGSGTTIIASEQLGRRCFAIEIEPRYVDCAVMRWERLTKKSAVHSESGKTWREVASDRGVSVEEPGNG